MFMLITEMLGNAFEVNLKYIILKIFARVCSGPQQKGQLAHQFKCGSANLGYCILHCIHANQHVQLRGDLQTTAIKTKVTEAETVIILRTVPSSGGSQQCYHAEIGR